MNSVSFVGQHPAEKWEARAAYTPVVVRAALGKCLMLVRQARLAIMDETIYNRGLNPPGRFTGRLRASEYAWFVGPTAVAGNNAPYAKRRHNMRGYSKRYQARRESFWATKAVRQTAPARAAIMRGALRQANRR